MYTHNVVEWEARQVIVLHGNQSELAYTHVGICNAQECNKYVTLMQLMLQKVPVTRAIYSAEMALQ